MRTFHTGGVAGIDITSGLPRVEELFEARVPKGKAILAELDGVVELQRTEDTRLIKVVSRQTYRDEHDLPEGYKARRARRVGRDRPAAGRLGQRGRRAHRRPPDRLGRGVAEQVNITSEEREEREYTVPASARSRSRTASRFTRATCSPRARRTPKKCCASRAATRFSAT